MTGRKWYFTAPKVTPARACTSVAGGEGGTPQVENALEDGGLPYRP